MMDFEVWVFPTVEEEQQPLPLAQIFRRSRANCRGVWGIGSKRVKSTPEAGKCSF